MIDQRDQFRKILENDLRVARYFSSTYYTDWEDTYEGLSKRQWLLYLQSHHPQIQIIGGNKKVYYYSLADPKDFLSNITQEIQKSIDFLDHTPSTIPVSIPPNIPQNLTDLVQELESKRLQDASERKIRRSISTDIDVTQKALAHQWEVERQTYLQNSAVREQEKQISDIKANTSVVLSTFATQAPGLLDDPAKVADISKNIAEKLAEVSTQKDSWDLLSNSDLAPELSSSLNVVLQQTAIANLPTALQEEINHALMTGTGGRELIDKVSSYVALERTAIDSKNYQKVLEEKQAGIPVDENHEKSFALHQQENARFYTSRYVSEIFNEIDTDLRVGFNLNQNQINNLKQAVIASVFYNTVDSTNYSLALATQEEIEAHIKQNVFGSFSSAITGLAIKRPVRDSIINSVRILTGGKPTDSLQKANDILVKIDPLIKNPSPQMVFSTTNAVFGNYSVNSASIEKGHPFGKIPYLIQLEFLKYANNPAGLDEIYGGMVNSPSIGDKEKIALNSLREYLKILNAKNPALAGLLSTYAKHRIPISLAKSSFSILLWHPEYVMQLPVYWGKTWWSIQSYYKIKVPLIRLLQKTPLVAPFARFWWKKNSWGFYMSPIERTKHEIEIFFLRKVLKGTGKSFLKLGVKFKNKFLINTGNKIIGLVISGPLGISLIFFGGFLKQMGKYVGFGAGAMLLWAVQHGIWGAGGFIFGFIGGNVLGVYLGSAVFAATAPFLGPFAIFPAALTWAFTTLIVSGIGTAIGVWASNVFGGNFGVPSASAAGLESAGLSAGALAPNLATGIVPFLPVITIGGVAVMSVYTMMVTSSAFFAPGGAPAGYLESKYINASKNADLFITKSHPLPPGTKVTDNWIAENKGYVVYTLSVSPKNQPLKNVVVKDVTRLTRRENPGSDKTTTSQIATKLLVDRGGGNYEFTDNTPENWTIPIIDQANPWAVKYGFVLNKDQTDSYINNAVNIEAEVEGETEKQSYTLSLTLTIGKPPVLPVVQIAKNLVDRLTACYPGPSGKAEVNQAVFGNGSCVSDSTKKPQGITFSNAALDQLLTSVAVAVGNPPRYVLQCIGFVQAVLQEVGTPFSKKDNAQDFYGYGGDGFVWHNNADLRNIKEGDVMIAQWLDANGIPVSGHAAIVISRNDNGFELAEALGYEIDRTDHGNIKYIYRGLTQYPSAFYAFDKWEKDSKNFKMGYLRYGE